MIFNQTLTSPLSRSLESFDFTLPWLVKYMPEVIFATAQFEKIMRIVCWICLFDVEVLNWFYEKRIRILLTKSKRWCHNKLCWSLFRLLVCQISIPRARVQGFASHSDKDVSDIDTQIVSRASLRILTKFSYVSGSICIHAVCCKYLILIPRARVQGFASHSDKVLFCLWFHLYPCCIIYLIPQIGSRASLRILIKFRSVSESIWYQSRAWVQGFASHSKIACGIAVWRACR